MGTKYITEKGYRWMALTRDGRLIVPEDDYGYDCSILGFPFESRQGAIDALEEFVEKGGAKSGSYVLVEQFAVVPTWG